MNHARITSAIRARHSHGLGFETVETIRGEVDSALVQIARKHRVSVGTLLKLASTGGSAQA